MVTWDNNIRIPVIVQTTKSDCSIYVPDLEVTAHGQDYIAAIANAALTCTAMYYYYLQHNLPFKLKYDYAEVEKMALKRGKGCFATFMCLSE